MGSSSETQQPQLPDSIPIDIIESSIAVLYQNWLRRLRWQQLFFQCQDEEENYGKHRRGPWRIHLINFLESTSVRAIALLLLLVDLIFTILDLSSSLLSCNPKRKTENKVFHWGGIVILSLFSAKILALTVALGASFFRRPGLIVDGVVVIGALLLEAFVEMKGAGLIVVVSLWRVVRVVESAFELSDETIEVQIQKIVCQFEALRDENRCLQISIAEKDQKIMELEEAMNQCSTDHIC
ncbi:uncharacterized protein LOC122643358 [Telopea speciosissima]|uniref:uncharacterized protein LOC122643358 n=1 Tax=Telopea speciosissima TaxID=54955 RepID=UPI001CC400C4|nr:uncharacterized protein LOC122643358 [Telopea speciosissima]